MCFVLIKQLISILHPIISVVSINESTLILYFMFMALFVVMVTIVYKFNNNPIEVFVSNIQVLDDGTYHIIWGYHNKSSRTYHVDYKESNILVSRGAALLLSNHPPIHFEKGKHSMGMEMVALDGSEIEWLIKDKGKKVSIDYEYKKKKGSEKVDE